VALRAHEALGRLAEAVAAGQALGGAGALDSSRKRSDYELAFQRLVVQPIFAARAQTRAAVTKLRAALDDGSEARAAAELGAELWDAVRRAAADEEPAVATAAAALAPSVWRAAEPIDLKTAARAFDMRAEHATLCPLLAELLRAERRAEAVGDLADVLAWHNLLFETLRPPLRREQARELTLAAVVDRLPPARRPAARALLERYCAAFNRGFPLVAQLHECQPNPLLGADGEVDLSGGGGGGRGSVRMGPDVPVSFSLPAIHDGGAAGGGVEANGLCTIQLCATLANAHNAILRALGGDANGRARAGAAPPLRLSRHTTPAAARAPLLHYRREQLLHALHAAHHAGCGPLDARAFAAAEAELRAALLAPWRYLLRPERKGSYCRAFS
jgi:hypothetical protein